MDSSRTAVSLPQDEELEAALTRSIGRPLAALRASLESLNSRLPGEDPLGGVIEEVLRIGTNVRELVEYSCPPAPHSISCTAAEITFDALRALSRADRERVTLARIQVSSRITTDPILLAKGLRRVIENALEAASDQVLVTLRQDGSTTTFCVIDDSSKSFDAAVVMAPFRSTKKNHLGLGLALTQRDLDLIGGSIRVDRTQLGDTCVSVSVPDQGASRA